MQSNISEQPSELIVNDAIQEYQRLTHHTVTAENIQVIDCTRIWPSIRSWHFSIEGEPIIIWEPYELAPRKDEAQALQVA